MPHSLRNKLICRKLKILKSSKGKAIFFIINEDMGGFLVRYIFQKVLLLFLTNKYGRPASTETTSLVINPYFIGFD